METKAALDQIMQISKELSPVKSRRAMKLLHDVNRVCRTLEIMSQITKHKASVRFMPMHLFCRAMVNEFERRIKTAFPWRKDQFLVRWLKFYVFMKIRYATRMSSPHLFSGQTDLAGRYFLQGMGEQA